MADKAYDDYQEKFVKFGKEIIAKYNTREKIDKYLQELEKSRNGDYMKNIFEIESVSKLLTTFDGEIMSVYGYNWGRSKKPKPISEFNKLNNSESCKSIIKWINSNIDRSDIYLLNECNSLPDWRTAEQKKFWDIK